MALHLSKYWICELAIKPGYFNDRKFLPFYVIRVLQKRVVDQQDLLIDWNTHQPGCRCLVKQHRLRVPAFSIK
jgi:hypothetical protein